MATVKQLEALGQLIRVKRGRMSAADLGERIGRSQSYVSAIENATPAQGRSKPITPPDDVLEALAAALELPLRDLHSALGRSEVTAELDPDLQMIVENWEGMSPTGKRAIKSAAELALEMSREGSIGKRAE